MKKTSTLNNLLTLALLLFAFYGHSQETSKIESVKNSIDEIIDDIHQAADTIEHIDQINAIYEAGSYVKLKNLIEYYEDLGGSKEQVDKYKVHHRVLGDRLQTRKHNIDIGNIVDLEYQAEVEEDIQELNALLDEDNPENAYSINRKYELLKKIFDLKMEENTVMEEWKKATSIRLVELKSRIDESSGVEK